ncbi:MAG: hypothetical protein PWR07_2295, partial [Bacillota bacterium]|nr:hypothetical protein [Bacillota bacterium]
WHRDLAFLRGKFEVSIFLPQDPGLLPHYILHERCHITERFLQSAMSWTGRPPIAGPCGRRSDVLRTRALHLHSGIGRRQGARHGAYRDRTLNHTLHGCGRDRLSSSHSIIGSIVAATHGTNDMIESVLNGGESGLVQPGSAPAPCVMTREVSCVCDEENRWGGASAERHWSRFHG